MFATIASLATKLVPWKVLSTNESTPETRLEIGQDKPVLSSVEGVPVLEESPSLKEHKSVASNGDSTPEEARAVLKQEHASDTDTNQEVSTTGPSTTSEQSLRVHSPLLDDTQEGATTTVDASRHRPVFNGDSDMARVWKESPLENDADSTQDGIEKDSRSHGESTQDAHTTDDVTLTDEQEQASEDRPLDNGDSHREQSIQHEHCADPDSDSTQDERQDDVVLLQQQQQQEEEHMDTSLEESVDEARETPTANDQREATEAVAVLKDSPLSPERVVDSFELQRNACSMFLEEGEGVEHRGSSDEEGESLSEACETPTAIEDRDATEAVSVPKESPLSPKRDADSVETVFEDIECDSQVSDGEPAEDDGMTTERAQILDESLKENIPANGIEFNQDESTVKAADERDYLVSDIDCV